MARPVGKLLRIIREEIHRARLDGNREVVRQKGSPETTHIAVEVSQSTIEKLLGLPETRGQRTEAQDARGFRLITTVATLRALDEALSSLPQ